MSYNLIVDNVIVASSKKKETLKELIRKLYKGRKCYIMPGMFLAR